MSGEGEAPHAPPRRRRREPLQAAPAPGPTPEPPADATAGHLPWRRTVVAGVALVAAVAALVLVAARAPSTTDDAAAPDFGLVRTETSAPRIPGVTAASATSADGTGAPPATLAAVDGVVVASDGVPSTGGYTDLIRSYFGSLTVEAIVIVQCESGFDPLAVGENTNGTRDHGLFQINDVHQQTFEAVMGRPWADIYDPDLNVAFAAWLHDRAGGWGPWRCNRNLEQFDKPLADGAEPRPEADSPADAGV